MKLSAVSFLCLLSVYSPHLSSCTTRRKLSHLTASQFKDAAGATDGLQQWGALGYAIDHFWSYEQILQHYYSNTTSSYVSDREVKVHITRNNEMDLLVTSANPFTVQGLQFYGGQIARLSANGPSSFNIRQSSGCADPGYPVYDGHPGQLDASGRTYIEAHPINGNQSVDDLTQLLQLVTCDRSNPNLEVSRHYRGSLGLIEQNGQYTFNRVNREQYLRGVVPKKHRRRGEPWAAALACTRCGPKQ